MSKERTYPLKLTLSEVVAIYDVLGQNMLDDLKDNGFTPELFDDFTDFKAPYKTGYAKIERLWKRL